VGSEKSGICDPAVNSARTVAPHAAAAVNAISHLQPRVVL
jgi:hypothetical protein